MSATQVSNITDDMLLLDLVGAGAGATWTPLSLTDLAAWYEPDLASDVRSQVAMAPDTDNGGVFATTLVSDSFDRADGALDVTSTDGPAGVDPLTYSGVSDSWSVSGNQITTTGGARCANVDVGTRDAVVSIQKLNEGERCGATVSSTTAGGRGWTGYLNGDTVLRLYDSTGTNIVEAIVPAFIAGTIRTARWGDRVRVWLDDVLYIDYTMTAQQLADPTLNGTFAGTYHHQSNVFTDDFSVRTVDPATDFAAVGDFSSEVDVGTTDQDVTTTFTSDLSGNEQLNHFRSSSSGSPYLLLYQRSAGTIRLSKQAGGETSIVTGGTVTDATAYTIRAICKDDRVWVWLNDELIIEHTFSAQDMIDTGAGTYVEESYGTITGASAAPSVSVLPDLSGQHRHATQTEDGTAGAYLSGDGLSLPGADDNYASATVVDGARPGAEAEFIVRAAATDWTPTGIQGLIDAAVTSDSDGTRLMVNSDGTVGIWIDGSHPTRETKSSVAVPFSDGEMGWIKATYRDSDDRVQFFTSTTDTDDPGSVSWTQLGTDQANTRGVPSYEGNTFTVGSSPYQSYDFDGIIRRALVAVAIDGTPTFDADFTGKRGATSFVEDSANAATVTINSTAVDRRPLLLPNVTDGATGALFSGDVSGLTVTGLAMTQPYSLAVAASSGVSGTNQTLWDWNGSGGRSQFRRKAGALTWENWGGSNYVQSSVASGTGDRVVDAVMDGNASIIRTDGVQDGGDTPGTAGIDNLVFFVENTDPDHANRFIDGRCAAILLTDADETANLSDIEAHLARHTTWTPS